MGKVIIEPSWKSVLHGEFKKKYFVELTDYVRTEYKTKLVYPPPKSVFSAFDLCPFEKVNVVIVGQDPYHGKNQANGLSFSVAESMQLPPSLQNIFKEIRSDLEITPRQSGDLSRWAQQGVFMLNAVLTVLANSPASHKGKGWELFTDAVIHALNTKRENIVYMLWGKYAQEKGAVIDHKKNLVLTSGHPSPYSAHLFFNNHHFSKCNQYLAVHGKKRINWS